jgi:16S rRNA (cytosine1402-N4)-methyltransferase
MMSNYHVPVLLHDAVDGLGVQNSGVFVDVTFGGGGHSTEILKRLGKQGKLIAFDQDADALGNMPNDPRFTLVKSNFKWLKHWHNYLNLPKVDGILADLGVSSHQFDDDTRGFSFRADAIPDMRMNQKQETSAVDILLNTDLANLTHILKEYGEIPNARALSHGIAKARENQPELLSSTTGLAQIATKYKGHLAEKKYLAMVFQALRIEVNGEMQALQSMLNAAADILKPHGRLVVISYHSLEDRMVKQFIRNTGANDHPLFNEPARFKEITKKPLRPTDDEMEQNPRARSAALRIAERM